MGVGLTISLAIAFILCTGVAIFGTVEYTQSGYLLQVDCKPTSKYYSGNGNFYSSVISSSRKGSSPPSYDVWCLLECDKFTTNEGFQYTEAVYQFQTSDLIHFSGAPRIGYLKTFSLSEPSLYFVTEDQGSLIKMQDGGMRRMCDWCYGVMISFWILSGIIVVACMIAMLTR